LAIEASLRIAERDGATLLGDRSIEWSFKARRVLIYSAELIFVQLAVTAVAGFALIAVGAGAAGLSTALLLGSAAALPLGLVLLTRRLGVLRDYWLRLKGRSRRPTGDCGLGPADERAYHYLALPDSPSS